MGDFAKYLIYFILISVAIFFIRKFLSKFKFPKIGALAVVVGGVKSGKSGVSVGMAISNYKRALRRWKIRNFFRVFFNCFRKNKIDAEEKPLLYSSIPLRYIEYVPLKREHLLRQWRLNFGSIVLLDEASLIADSQLIKDKDINTDLLLFFKLFGHETHGGKCIVNTHCISDLHYALKRTTSQYFYMHHLSGYIPFLTLAYMREERYSEDGAVVNNYDNDLEDSLKRVLMRKKLFKAYDPFCFSVLTDNLPVKNDLTKKGKYDSLKATELTSFRPEFFNLDFSGKKKQQRALTVEIDKETGEIKEVSSSEIISKIQKEQEKNV